MLFMTSYHPTDTIIFLHISKTAGKSLRKVITKQYRGKEIFYFYPNPTQEELESLKQKKSEQEVKVLLGHYRYGIHEYLQRPYTYITFLRNPVDQVISHYYHLVRSKKAVHMQVVSDIKSLRSFADFEWARNLQTGYLTGIYDIREVEKDPEGALSLAKKRLLEDIFQFGITERFDESLLLLREKLGWENTWYQRFNVARNRPEKNLISDEDLQAIRKNNQVDIALYEFALSLFDKRIHEIPGFEEKLKAFRQKNKVAQRYLKTKDAVKKVLTGMNIIKE